MAGQNLSNMKPEDFKEFMNSFDTVLTDCDGVLWLGTTIIQGSPNTINFLKKSGKRIFYVTNNSTKTQKELLSKIDSMGFNASEVAEELNTERKGAWVAWTFTSKFIFYCGIHNGVLWIYSEIISGSPQTINRLKEIGKKIFYVTNNSTKTRDELYKKSQDMGYKSDKEEVVSTAYLAAKYLQDQGFKDKVYVIGSTGITQEMDMAGIKHTDIGPDHMPSSLPQLISQKLDPDVKAVVVGFDEHFSYPKMLKAASYLARKDCLFVATNTDEQFPMNTELVIPGTGSIVRAVETCGARNAFVVGKPHSYISEFLVKTHKIDPTRTIMIGDRCNTDILLGKRCGFKTLLVLSGVSTVNEINSWKESSDEELRQLVPDFYIGKLGDLLPMME